jgi:Holliday junction resolvase
MTAYRRGLYREMLTAAELARDGYVVVTSRGSHGPADVVALKRGQVLLIQVKSGDTEFRGAWWNALWEQSIRAGAIPVIADWPRRATLRLRRITGPHDARSHTWPLEPFTVDLAAEGREA